MTPHKTMFNDTYYRAIRRRRLKRMYGSVKNMPRTIKIEYDRLNKKKLVKVKRNSSWLLVH